MQELCVGYHTGLPGGVIAWNMAGSPGLYENYMSKARELAKKGLWELVAERKVPAMSAVDAHGYVIVMRKK